MADDFRKLPVGTKIDRGEIGVCPYCGEIGLILVTNDTIFTIHTEWSALVTDGSLHIGGDECPKPGEILKRVPKEPA